jgi:hypothetical protein
VRLLIAFRGVTHCDICTPFLHCGACWLVFWLEARLTSPFRAESPDPPGVSAAHKYVTMCTCMYVMLF